MKAIINGLRYDTDKAELIGEAEHGRGKGDFNNWSAGLYVTPRAKRYFIAGEGGGLTTFASHHAGGTRSWGSRIIPLEQTDARLWAEANLDPETIEQFFPVEDA